MKTSKEQVENAILFFAKKFGKEQNYKDLMSTYPGTPKIVEMIVYLMFLNEFNPHNCTEDEYLNYKLIYEYSIELNEVGWVTYE